MIDLSQAQFISAQGYAAMVDAVWTCVSRFVPELNWRRESWAFSAITKWSPFQRKDLP
jgi:hypothetical protein